MPTLPPDLILPPRPSLLQDWPALPADLFFLREGKVWLWLAEGGSLESLPVAVEGEQVLSYRVTKDQRFILYVTDAGKLYAFDRAQWQHTFIPTAGRLIDARGIYFDVSPDIRSLVYLAWDVRPTAETITESLGFGTVLAIELSTLRKPQRMVGFCSATEQAACGGVYLAPNGNLVAYEDGAGLWLSALDNPTPRLASSSTETESWRFKDWSPDSRWLILERQNEQGTLIGLLNGVTGSIFPITAIPCGEDCRLELSWGTQNLWISTDTSQQGCLYQIQPPVGNMPLTITYQTCALGPWALHPVSPLACPSGGVAFVHHGCGDDCPGPAPGLYLLESAENVRPIALLDDKEGYTLWTADGAAFLYLNTGGQALRLGLTDGSGFWDVSRPLAGAHAFYWSALLPPNE